MREVRDPPPENRSEKSRTGVQAHMGLPMKIGDRAIRQKALGTGNEK